MIELLIALLIICLVIWFAQWLLSQIAMPQPLRVVILVCVVVICLIWLARRMGVTL